MKYTHYSLGFFGAILLSGLLFSYSALADDFKAIRYCFNTQKLQAVKSLGQIHLGKDITLSESFLYYDYANQPVAYVVSFKDTDSEKIAGSVYLAVNNLIPIEIIRDKPLHEYPFERIKVWLSKTVGEIENVELIKVYYHPLMYPILKVRVNCKDGNKKLVLVDPELEEIINKDALDYYSQRFFNPRHLTGSDGTDLDALASKAIPTEDGWNIKQLDVYEVTTKSESWFGCAPHAAANVLGYWNDHEGCEIFHDSCVNAWQAEVELLLSDLKYNMVWWKNYTTCWSVDDGIRETLSQKNITGSADADLFFTFLTIMSEINNGRPCILGASFWPWSELLFHYVCVIGYKTYGASFYVILHDGYNSTPNQPREQNWFIGSSGILNPLCLCRVSLECPKTIAGVWGVDKYDEWCMQKPEDIQTGTLFVFEDQTYKMQLDREHFEGTWILEENFMGNMTMVTFYDEYGDAKLNGFVNDAYNVIQNEFMWVGNVVCWHATLEDTWALYRDNPNIIKHDNETLDLNVDH